LLERHDVTKAFAGNKSARKEWKETAFRRNASLGRKRYPSIILHPVRDASLWDARWYLLFVFLPRDASLTGCKFKIVVPLKTC